MADKTLDQTIVDCREHVIYAGVTMTGKTTLARHHARILDRAKHITAVYDPVGTATAGGYWPDNAIVLDSTQKFDKFIEQAQGTEKHPIFLFVDESPDVFNHAATENHWIPRRIRHNHIFLRMIAQRPKMLHPDVRSQCSYAYVLRLAADDKKMILADFGHSGDIEKKLLDKGDCMLLTSGAIEIEEFNVFDLVHRRKLSPAQAS